MKPHFNIINNCPNTDARSGKLLTTHGEIATPVFLPVGSQATVKSLTPEEIKSIGFKMILSNTYHLYLRPGISVIKDLGGLHKFMNWDGAILTDSGGYQIFSLARLNKINDEGVLFRSHVDGSKHLITPELAIQLQEDLGSDIAMVLDECPAHDGDFNTIQKAVDRTYQWAKRCHNTHQNSKQALYAIIQGGAYPELRRKSAEYLCALDFDGYAIGGVSIGEPKEITYSVTGDTAALLPEEKPRYLMGVGSPDDIVECVARGIDIFDSALPTRVARNGALFTPYGRRNISNAVFAKLDQPIDTDCQCYTCRNFTAAYLHHLFNCQELLAYRLATIHNLTFVNKLMVNIRDAINNCSFDSFRNNFLDKYKVTNEEVRLSQKEKWLKSRRLNQ